MESSDFKGKVSLVNKFKILNIKCPGHYQRHTKKLQNYLTGIPEKIDGKYLPDGREHWPDENIQRIFTRQTSYHTTTTFSAVHKLSDNEPFNKHSLCGSRKEKRRMDVSPENILEYRCSGAKQLCVECGLQVFELDFAFICCVCGQLVHKGCTDVCKRRHKCVLCGGEILGNRIYPFCQTNNLSEIINGDETTRRTFKKPSKTQAEKCFPVIRPIHATAKIRVNAESKMSSDNRKRQRKRCCEYALPLSGKRRKLNCGKDNVKRNIETRHWRRQGKSVPYSGLHTTCKVKGNERRKQQQKTKGNKRKPVKHKNTQRRNDVLHKVLKTKRSENDIGLCTKETKTQPSHAILKEDISLFISKTMDFLGYSFEMIKYRQRMYHANDEVIARFSRQPDTRVTTGGKGEGTTMYFENDTDYMFLVKNVICTDCPQVFVNIKGITIFLLKRNMTSPGYTRLELFKFSGRYCREEIRASLVESQSGYAYLSNEAFIHSLQSWQVKTCILGGFERSDRSGPSTPISDKYNSYDDVVGFPCCCPDLLTKWLSRPRPHKWPPQDVLHAISLLDAHVVPVGFKGSPDQGLEWRICFSLAELHLMQILNECQIQTYVLLKTIAKTCLQPVSKDITSYVVKNTILWICEKNPASFFQKKHVLQRLMDCIEYLRQCVRKNTMPSYMLSERNLLAGRLDRSQRHQLVHILSDLKREEGRVFLRIRKFREAMLVMYKTPDTCCEYGRKRDILERTVLIRNWIREAAWKPEMTKTERNWLAEKHKAYKILEREIDDILQVDTEQLLAKGWELSEINDLWMERMYLLLS